MKRAVLLIALLPGLALAAGSSIYRWVDESGQVHYTQTPPPHQPSEPVRIASPQPLGPSGSATPPQATSPSEFLKKAEEADKAEAEAKAKAQQAMQEKDAKCQQAKARIEFLNAKTARRLATVNDDGSYNRMDDAEFDKRKAEAQKIADANCG